MEQDPIHKNKFFDFDTLIQSKLDELKSNGSYRQFLSIEKSAASFPRFNFIDDSGNKKEVTNWCTNDYLALSTWQENIDIANKTNDFVGTGSGGTRNISGNTTHHRLLENRIASWHQKERALLFNSAYQANLTTLATLGRMIPQLIFISDEENHASMIEGMRSTSNQKIIFRHNDTDHLASILSTIDPTSPKIIVFESVYSISGSIAPIEKIISLAKKYQCLTYIDEVHAVGLYGGQGAGKLNELDCSDQVDFINGTLAKAIGAFGGYIAASNDWIDFIRSFASGFIFTTSLPPALCAVADHSIHEIVNNQSLRDRFFEHVKNLRTCLDQQYIIYSGHHTHITNIHIGNAIRCKEISDRLLNQYGIYVQPINQPTVKKGDECLRITITPRHSLEDIQYLAIALNEVLKQKIILTGRSSRLSKIQIEIVKQKINQQFPNLDIEIKYKDTRGDQLAQVPLHTQEGIDFFTEDLFNDLEEGHADIAVHSLKDMSSEHFFGKNTFAVIDRDEVRDLAIFNSNIIEKIKSGHAIKIGTCSFRRETMALHFLKKALPQFGNEINIEAIPIRGNIDTRLKKLSSGEYDGIILAVAGINRMYKNVEDAKLIKELLKDKKIMVLPLVDCIPAPCQGAIVAECLSNHSFASHILDKIKDIEIHNDCVREKRIASQYGSGCIQKFGVTSINLNNKMVTLSKGVNDHGNEFEDWHGLEYSIPSIAPSQIILSDELGYTAIKTHTHSLNNLSLASAFFVAHISAVESIETSSISTKRIWTAGTSTWYKMAKKGIWVEGCADSMGFKSIQSLLKTDLINIDPFAIHILTNKPSALKWMADGYNAMGTYDIQYQSSLINKYKLISAQMIFWNCFAHYDSVKEIVPANMIHACLPGKTAEQLKSLHLNPIVFPTLDAFNQWKKKYTLQYIAA